MKCPSWAYNSTMARTTGLFQDDRQARYDDLCPCCTTSWITDHFKYLWYRIQDYYNSKPTWHG